MLKLWYYLAFKQKIQKMKFVMEKPKNLFFRGLNSKKGENPRFALLIVSKSRNHPTPPTLN